MPQNQTYILTLIAAPKAQDIFSSFTSEISDQLQSSCQKTGDINWLNTDIAAEISILTDNPKSVLQQAKEIIGTAPIDTIIQPQKNRHKKILLADMESTIIEQEMLDELAEFAGIRDRIAKITEIAMRGEMDFATAMTERLTLLKGLPESHLKTLVTEKLTYSKGARTLINTLKSKGVYCVLISGGFTYFTSIVANELGFDEHHGNQLEIQNGKLTGRLAAPLKDQTAKTKILAETTAKLCLNNDDVIAIGDGANDIPMLKTAGCGIAYHAKPKVRKEAPHQITHTDLTSLLYAEGYHINQFLT